MTNLEQRRVEVRSRMRWFATGHLAPRRARIVAEFGDLAERMVETLPDDDELVKGLDRLIEAKDCMVRAEDARAQGGFDTMPDRSMTVSERLAVEVVVAHQRKDIGSCICGWGVETGNIGQSHAAHVVGMLANAGLCQQAEEEA